MKKSILAACAAMMLTACQTIEQSTSGYSPENKPTIVTRKTIDQAKSGAKAVFNRPSLGFQTVSETGTHLLFSKAMPANINDNNSLKDRTKGRPLVQIELTFQQESDKTRVVGQNWMLLNPNGANKDKFDLLQTPDGPRLQARMNEFK
ncbi:hypothetical protein [Roseibium polysiphoniae]|uniref:hypothetical protein n=1 Tax=Roseibium polysiphoniae TaxID=2571221 RepID=UPI0032979DB6